MSYLCVYAVAVRTSWHKIVYVRKLMCNWLNSCLSPVHCLLFVIATSHKRNDKCVIKHNRLSINHSSTRTALCCNAEHAVRVCVAVYRLQVFRRSSQVLLQIFNVFRNSAIYWRSRKL